MALFASLGGTGYAATQMHSGATEAKAKSKAKAPKPVTTAQVNKLIAAYLKAHKIVGPQGVQGVQGLQGIEGKIGPQGPGAKSISVTMLGNATPVVVAVGPWTVKVTCTSSLAEYEVTGPGSIAYTSSFGTNNVSGASVTNGHGLFTESAFKVGVGTAHQSYLMAFLTSGATAEQLSLEVSAANGGLFETCEATGDAIPAS